MRILIAEDSKTQAVDLRRRLEHSGHTVTLAPDGLAAWNHLQARPEPLVISDWMMPELNGLDLCRKIRAEISSPYIYFILLTAKSHRHERLQGLNAGADDFLTKPIDSIELDIALRTAQRILAAQESLQSRALELERKNQELSQHSTLDPMTGLRGSCVFEEALASACLQAAAASSPLSLIRLEIDGFAWLPVGASAQEVLIGAARSLLAMKGEADVATRFGEQGFSVILPGRDLAECRRTAEAIRSAIAAGLEAIAGLSVNVGVVAWSPGPQLVDPAALIEACEADLMARSRGTEPHDRLLDAAGRLSPGR